MSLFKKSKVIGVSVTPGIGLEVAEVDFNTKTVLKYASKPLEFNTTARQVADLDIFKETLQDLFIELSIDSSYEVVLNIPAVTYKAAEYPAMMDEVETTNAITETLLALPYFESDEPCYSASKLPSSSMQFNRFVYTAARYSYIYELALSIKDLGYKIHAIDTSVSSTYNALNFVGRLNNVEPDTSWVLMLIDNTSCRVIPMQGYSVVDVYEEKIAIGEVLGDAENYSVVLSTVQPILKNTPSKYLYVVSQTDIISAEAIAQKIQYNAPIIHQEANKFNKEAFLEIAPDVDNEIAQQISLCVIGAAIRREIEQYKVVNLNLFNRLLGDLYMAEQPPEITIFGKTLVLSNENLVKTFIVITLIALVISVPIFLYYVGQIAKKSADEADINQQIAAKEAYLRENSYISSDTFDEGMEVKTGLVHNKGIYSYYTIVGTEIPKKLWLTHLKLGNATTIEGQADNLESIYAFFRSIKDYEPDSDIKLQKLGLASSRSPIANEEGNFDTESLLTSLNADFYEFRISNEPEVKPSEKKDENGNEITDLPDLESTN